MPGAVPPSDRSGSSGARIPLTVIGGYLGAGKTTLVNQLLRHAGGRRIGVIVNDFGAVGIDVELLASSAAPAGDDGAGIEGSRIVSLTNGCVCCTIGSGLQDALAGLTALDPPPDHIVVEVSGVADPAGTAAWATVPPFEPGGVVVLAAADSIRSMARDRLVGDEVRRQLTGADLIVVTKRDLCPPDALAVVERWLDELTGGTPRVGGDRGDVPAAVLLGLQPAGRTHCVIGDADGHDHDDRDHDDRDRDQHADRYVTWDWRAGDDVTRSGLEAFLAELPAGVLRLKGFVTLDDGTTVVVQRVGRRAAVAHAAGDAVEAGCVLVAIGLRELVDPESLTRLAQAHLR
jgi:G3E family GTPase